MRKKTHYFFFMIHTWIVNSLESALTRIERNGTVFSHISEKIDYDDRRLLDNFFDGNLDIKEDLERIENSFENIVS